MRFLAIDFETATARRDSACAVGVALVEEGRIALSESYLIKPPGNLYDGINIGIHGITPDMTAGAEPFMDVMDAVLDEYDDLALVAHNASFDMSVLRAGYASSGYSCPRRQYYCTLLMSRVALPNLDSHRLPQVFAACGGRMSNHHDPKADAEACAEIALSLARNNGAATLEDLSARIGMRPGRLCGYSYEPCRCSGGRK